VNLKLHYFQTDGSYSEQYLMVCILMCGLNGDEYTHAGLGMNCFKCVSSVRYTTVYTYNQNLAFYYLRAHYRL